MKIVIAGGTGLIGSALTRALLGRGHTVTILSRRRIPEKVPSNPSLYTVRWDGLTTGAWAECLGGADAVINLTGASLGNGRWTDRRKQEILDSRVKPTNVLIEAMKKVARRPQLLINQSATGYYGDVPEEVLDERSPPGTDFLATVCRAWEDSAEAARKIGLRVVRMRTGVVVHHQAPAFQKIILPFRFFAGGWYGRGSQWFPWIHLHDAVEGYRHVLEHPSLSGPVNMVAPESLRVRDFMTTLGQVMGRPAWIPVPGFALRVMLGEMADMLLHGQRVVPKVLLEGGMTFRFPAARGALSQELLVGRADERSRVSEMGRTP
jgi:uncharacterized protein (TIGR01777 family)